MQWACEQTKEGVNEQKSRAFWRWCATSCRELEGVFSVSYEISENRRVKESRDVKRDGVCGLRKPSTKRTHVAWQLGCGRGKKGQGKEGESRPVASKSRFIWLQAVSFFFPFPLPSLFSPDACIMQLALLAGRVLITPYMHNKEKARADGRMPDTCVVCQIALYTALQMIGRSWPRAKFWRPLYLSAGITNPDNLQFPAQIDSWYNMIYAKD